MGAIAVARRDGMLGGGRAEELRKKIAVLAPMPMASVTRASAVNSGVCFQRP
jgi:hypothetical protein